jgi:hypothetical protein
MPPQSLGDILIGFLTTNKAYTFPGLFICFRVLLIAFFKWTRDEPVTDPSMLAELSRASGRDLCLIALSLDLSFLSLAQPALAGKVPIMAWLMLLHVSLVLAAQAFTLKFVPENLASYDLKVALGARDYLELLRFARDARYLALSSLAGFLAIYSSLSAIPKVP